MEHSDASLLFPLFSLEITEKRWFYFIGDAYEDTLVSDIVVGGSIELRTIFEFHLCTNKSII